MENSLKKFRVKFMKGRLVNGCLRVDRQDQTVHKLTVHARNDFEAMRQVRGQVPATHSMWAQEVK